MEYNLNVAGKKIIIISGLLITLSIPLTLSLIRQQTNPNSHAAAPDQLEAEGGVLGGNAQIKTDALASGGQYIAFSNQTPTPTPLSGLKYPPDTTLTTKSVPSFARPGYLNPVTEPTFGTKLTRVTDPSAFGGSSTIRHAYSKVSAWNRDGSKILIGKYILDGKTYSVIKNISALTGEYRWSNTDPNKIFVIEGDGDFRVWDVNSVTNILIRTFAGYEEVRMGPWEGNISLDDGMVVLSGRNGTDYAVIVFNIKENRIITTKTFPGKWDAGIDWASISPNGKYVVINTSYCDPQCGDPVYSYDLNMNLITQVSKGSHGDLATDLDGNDYFVYVLGETGGYITKSRVDTGQKTVLLKIPTGGHISCRNILRPGWCYATIANSSYREAFGFKLDGTEIVNRFAHHRSTESNYDTQAKGVVSMDGTKMLWTSDWGYIDGSFFDYIAESY